MAKEPWKAQQQSGQHQLQDAARGSGLASGSAMIDKTLMKEALTEILSKVPGLKELMTKPVAVPPSPQEQQGNQIKSKRRLIARS